mgnify:CR=1 FL=1
MSESVAFGVGQSVGSRLAVLGRLIKKQAEAGAARLNVLEVGSYEGGSALALSSFIIQHCEHGGSITCIDPWQPYLPEEDVGSNETCRRMQEDFKAGTVFERFVDNIKHAHEKAPISFYVGTLAEAIKGFALLEGQYDLVYIDGSHAYKDVLSDIRNAKRLLKVGGVMCGDDLERQFEESDKDLTFANKHREFINGYHPGVTLAVWKAFGKVWCEEAVWAVRKIDKQGKHWSSP